MENSSGIYPVGDRVLIKPVDVERTTDGGIIIPETIADHHGMAQSIGIVIEVGPDCWTDWVEKDNTGRVTSVRGFSGPYARVGDRVVFAKYGGVQVEGKDGQTYRLMNDVDITARADEGVSFTDLKSRKAFARTG